MKKLILMIIAVSLIGLVACNSSKPQNAKSEITENQRAPLKTTDEAIAYITEHFKRPEETLWIASSLNDKVGMNMAIIGDKLLKTGYLPNGFEQRSGYRIYKYKQF